MRLDDSALTDQVGHQLVRQECAETRKRGRPMVGELAGIKPSLSIAESKARVTDDRRVQGHTEQACSPMVQWLRRLLNPNWFIGNEVTCNPTDHDGKRQRFCADAYIRQQILVDSI